MENYGVLADNDDDVAGEIVGLVTQYMELIKALRLLSLLSFALDTSQCSFLVV